MKAWLCNALVLWLGVSLASGVSASVPLPAPEPDVDEACCCDHSVPGACSCDHGAKQDPCSSDAKSCPASACVCTSVSVSPGMVTAEATRLEPSTVLVRVLDLNVRSPGLRTEPPPSPPPILFS